MSETNSEAYEGWASVELLGHRKVVGMVRQVDQFGSAMLRVDIPGEGAQEWIATQFYAGSAIYCVTPTTEHIARASAGNLSIEPVSHWELRDDKSNKH